MMMIQSIKKAESKEQALNLLQGHAFRIIAGGTDVIVQNRAGLFEEEDLLDISALRSELSSIEIKDDCLCIGAMATHQMISESAAVKEWCAPLALACGKVGAPQIRHKGTIGGNICNASPAADSVPVLVACGAEAVIESADGKRTILAEEIAVRPGKTSLGDHEILTQLRIPLKRKAWNGVYHKVGHRNALSISIADAAVLYHPVFGYRVSCGSVGPVIRRNNSIEMLFQNADVHGMIEKDIMAEAVDKDIHPISDIRGSREYRRQVLINLLYDTYQSVCCKGAV